MGRSVKAAGVEDITSWLGRSEQDFVAYNDTNVFTYSNNRDGFSTSLEFEGSLIGAVGISEGMLACVWNGGNKFQMKLLSSGKEVSVKEFDLPMSSRKLMHEEFSRKACQVSAESSTYVNLPTSMSDEGLSAEADVFAIKEDGTLRKVLTGTMLDTTADGDVLAYKRSNDGSYEVSFRKKAICKVWTRPAGTILQNGNLLVSGTLDGLGDGTFLIQGHNRQISKITDAVYSDVLSCN